MSIEAFDPEILSDFLTESNELLDELEGDLVQLETRAQDDDLIDSVFRALHTIKGSASFLALTNLVEIAHAAETALNAARNHQFVIDRHAMDLLLRAVDVIKTQLGELDGGSPDLTKADDALVAGLTALGDGTPPPDDDGPAGSTPEPEAGAEERAPARLELPESKRELLEHFIADLDNQLESLDGLVADLADAAERDSAATKLGEVGEELEKTIGFFEHDAMLAVARDLMSACELVAGANSENASAADDSVRRILAMLREQTEGLRSGEVIQRSAADLVAEVEGLISEASDALGAGGATDDSADSGARAEPSAEASSGAAEPETPRAAGSADREQSQAGGSGSSREQTIRVEVGRLESLMNLVGELVLQKNRIGELARRIMDEGAVPGELREQVELASGALERVTGDTQLAVMRTRMQPLDKLFGKYPRLIRDLSSKTGKRIRLEIEGGETEVDKSVIEELGDPLVHLIRNSADHGLEPAGERREAGKDETGTITLSAGQEGDSVRIRIMDDGRGLSRERIGRKAIERGLTTEAEVNQLSDDEVARFIFLPGFSTVDQVSDLSGRGVGMDVVRTNIEQLKGSIDVATTPGVGTTFTIKIPLTVAIMPAMMIRICGETYAVPLGSIVEIVKPSEEQLSTIVQERVLRVRGSVLPLLDACDVFAVPPDRRERGTLALVLSWGDREAGLLVTGVIGQQEIVIKPLDGVERSGPVSGATVRNDGGVSLIIDVAELVRQGAVARGGGR